LKLSLFRVGLVHTDASCVRPMGYLAIYLGILLVNLVDLVLVPKYIVTIPPTPSSLSATIPCLHEPPPAAAAASTRIPRPAPPPPPHRCISPSSTSTESNNPKRPQHGRLYWNGRILGGSPWRSPAARGDLTISKGGRRQRKVVGWAQTGVRCTMMR